MAYCGDIRSTVVDEQTRTFQHCQSICWKDFLALPMAKWNHHFVELLRQVSEAVLCTYPISNAEHP